jgi:hypothetical protein
MSRLIPSYIEQALRIELLERAVIASEGDVKRLECELAEAREQLRLCNIDQFTTAAELAEAQEELNDKRKFAYAVEQALDGLKGDYVEIIKVLRDFYDKAYASGVAAIAEAVAKERERCARVCEERGNFNSMYAHHILTGAAEAIRKGE